MKYVVRGLLVRALDWIGYKAPRPVGSAARFYGKTVLMALVTLAFPSYSAKGFVVRTAGRVLVLIGRVYRPANDFVVRSFGVDGLPEIVEFPTGRLQGYRLPWHKDFTIGFMLRGGIVEQEVSDAAEAILQKGDVVFDIGANLGFTALHFADLVGPQGKVFAFEPDPGLANRLYMVRDLNSLPQLIVRREAVSHECGSAQFIVGEESYLGRLAEEVALGNRLITVNTTSVDRAVDQEGLAQLALVKIDVEGGK